MFYFIIFFRLAETTHRMYRRSPSYDTFIDENLQIQALEVSNELLQNATGNCVDELREVYYGPGLLIRGMDKTPNYIIMKSSPYHPNIAVGVNEQTIICGVSMVSTDIENIFLRTRNTNKENQTPHWRLSVPRTVFDNINDDYIYLMLQSIWWMLPTLWCIFWALIIVVTCKTFLSYIRSRVINQQFHPKSKKSIVPEITLC